MLAVLSVFMTACGGSENTDANADVEEITEEVYMACHWAQNAVVLIGSVLVLALLIRVFIPSRDIKTGITLTSFLLSIAAALIPGVFINLCMMDTMRCHSAFKPGVIAVSAVLAVLTGIDSAVGIVKGRKG